MALFMRNNSSFSLGSDQLIHDGISSESIMGMDTGENPAATFNLDGQQNVEDDFISAEEDEAAYLNMPVSANRCYIPSDEMLEVYNEEFSDESDEKDLFDSVRIAGKWKKFECRMVKGHKEGIACFAGIDDDCWYSRSNAMKIKSACVFGFYTFVMCTIASSGFVYLREKKELVWMDYISYFAYSLFIGFAFMNVLCIIASLLPLEDRNNRGYTTQRMGEDAPKEHLFLKLIRFTMWCNAMWALMGAISTFGVLMYIIYYNFVVFAPSAPHYVYTSTVSLFIGYAGMSIIHTFLFSNWTWHGLYRLFDVNDKSTSTAVQKRYKTKRDPEIVLVADQEPFLSVA